MNRPPVRERHNAKGRQSTAGGSRKKGKRASNKSGPSTESFSHNVAAELGLDIHVPKTAQEKELDRKEKRRQELLAELDSRANTKKRKRLDKYIEKKLKKEERVQVLEKLSKSQAQLPSTTNLQSSSTLGTGRVSTNRERREKQEDKQVRQALAGGNGKRKRQNDNYDVLGVESSEDDSNHSDFDMDSFGGLPTNQSRASTIARPSQPVSNNAVGSALQRNPDGTVVAPTIGKARIKSNKNAFRSWKDGPKSKHVALEEVSDTSFDSSDSANDSDGSEDDNDEESSDSEGDNDNETPSNDQTREPPAKRSLGAFKNWAMKQLGASKGYDPTPDPDPDAVQTDNHPPIPLPPTKKRKTSHPPEMRGPLGEDLQIPTTSFSQRLLQPSATAAGPRVKAVTVSRSDEVQEGRMLLPIVSEEHPIMEAVLLNPVVIICGETGSGKTTQVPQFLFEAGFGTPGSDNPGMIGVTQPRRVAAMSMASRVAHELALPASRVSYQIRYDATVSPNTSIKFMTDGVLLRELATDFLLTKYSVIIIDEAHERSMNTDILIGVLSRVLKLREEMWKEGKEGARPLRLIVMSATLRVSDFAANTTLFPTPPPVINVAARQHPVTVHFSRRTPSDYVKESVKKAIKIHARLPPGGILIFLTGQNEITGVCRKLEAKFGAKALAEKRKRRAAMDTAASMAVDDEQYSTVAPIQADVEAEDVDLGGGVIENDLAFDVDDDLADEDPEGLDSDDDEDEAKMEEELGIEETDAPMHIVPLYSLLPSEKQMKVFQPPPEGHRLVVVSTNVAETSLTIPGIRYVIDSGRAKERRYDVANGIQAFQVSWISKASASQRSGRAGRTGPGHCYRLFSSALFEHHFDAFSKPEILRTPIEGVVLQMKSMHIDAVINFPFPTPPDRLTLRHAETLLTRLGALGVSSYLTPKTLEVSTRTFGGPISELGKAMSLFPLSPRFSRMLVSGQQQGCLPYVISIVSALSVGDPFLHEEALGEDDDDDDDDLGGQLAHIKSAAVRAKEAKRIQRRAFFQSQHLHSSLGKSTSDIFRILSVVGAYEYAGGGHKFCAEHFVRPKAMQEIHKLRSQITNIVQVNFPGANAGFISDLQPPSDLQLKVLRQLLTAGFIDQVAVRKSIVETDSSSGVQYATSKGVPYKAFGISEDVFIHPSSVLTNTPPPDFVVFHEIVRTTKVWLKGVTVINAAWLSSLGKDSMCTFSKPAKNSSGVLMVVPKFGEWELPPIKAPEVNIQ